MLIYFPRAFLLLVGGLLAITLAVLLKIFSPYDLIFRWKLVFAESGEVLTIWEKLPIDLYLKVYLFNITNAEAFLAGREKLNVEQVGPYVYKENMTHKNVTFNNNGTVSAKPNHPLVFQQELSGDRREDDVVIMLNIAMLAIAQVVSTRSFFVRFPVNVLLAKADNNPIAKMTAREFMFGYPSSITTLGNTFLPGWIYFDKVGLIDRMYDFETDYETFYTGSHDPRLSGLYDTYCGSPNLPQWNGEHCSNIRLASDGAKFKSLLEPNETVLFFRKSMCRPQRLVRVGQETTVGDLAGYRYEFEENALDNGEFEERNKCFCRQGYCQPRGLIDVTDCYYGFPISLSYPHFMDADPGLMNNVTGLSPNNSEHKSYFIIEPRSGLPLSISAKIQINMHMRNLAGMNKVQRFSGLTIPMLWFDITMAHLPPTLNDRFNFLLNQLAYVDSISFWGSLLIGITFLVFAITRATVRMSYITKISENGLSYDKVKLHAAVYNPCETQLSKAFEIEKVDKKPLFKKSETVSITKTTSNASLVENRASVFDLQNEDNKLLTDNTYSEGETEYAADDMDSREGFNSYNNMSENSNQLESNDCETRTNSMERLSPISLGDFNMDNLPILRIVEDGDEDHTTNKYLFFLE